MQRSAQAVWHGTGIDGKGSLTTKSGALSQLPYSTHARFVDEAGTAGTNPEELLAAVHAGCFTMALSFQLSNAGLVPGELDTKAVLTMEKLDAGWTITGMHLSVQGTVPGASAEQFGELAAKAKAGCPISRALNVPITMDATLRA